MTRTILIVAFIVGSAGIASANEARLIVRPGMDVRSHENGWKEKCDTFVLTENKDEENYLTCTFDNGDAATANIAPHGVAWWASYQDASGGPRSEFVSDVLDELAISTPAEACSIFGDPAECWDAGSFRVTIEMEARAGSWIVEMEDRSIFDPDTQPTND